MRLIADRVLYAGRRLSGPHGETIVPVIAALSLRLERPGRFAGGCCISTPLGVTVQGTRRGWRPLPLAARGPSGLLAALLVGTLPGSRRGHADHGGERLMSDHDPENGQPPGGEETLEQRLLAAAGRVSGASTIAGALAGVARPEAAIGAPVSAGAYTAVPLLESMFAGGYGMGLGGGNAPDGERAERRSIGGGGGGGGGGAGRSRVVTVLVIGPDGVELRPVVDRTKLGLAAIAAAIGVAGVLRKLLR